MQNLNIISDKLKANPDVDALLIVGSQGRNENKSYSDIDLVVILKNNALNIRSIFQWIDDKPSDIFIFDHSDLENIETSTELSTNKMDAVLLDWLDQGKIEFDKSNKITNIISKTPKIRSKLSIPESEAKSFQDKINSGYIINKRYFESNNPAYHETLELKLLQDITNVIVGYFEFRNIPWRGEKNAIKYLKNNDVDFYNIYTEYIKSTSISKKFSNYAMLVEKVFYGNFKLWNKDDIIPFSKNLYDKNNEIKTITYWKNLIS